MSNRLVNTVKCVWETRAILGEGPLHDPRNERLYWVDIKGEKLFAMSLRDDKKQTWSVPGNISALGLHSDGGLVAVGRLGFCHITFDENEMPLIKYLNDPENHIEKTRFNDGAVDPYGYFWAGTMDDAEVDSEAGNWWRYAPSGQVEKMASGFHVTNGPVFDAERKIAYLTDSARQIIYRADYLNASSFGELAVFKQFGRSEGYPDGMAIDREGTLWVAFWDGSCLRRISTDGEVIETVKVPVKRPTCPVIIGDKIYVTSASIGLEGKKNVLAGSLFEIALRSNIGLDRTDYFALKRSR